MLIFTRKKGESIIIGEDIKVTVIKHNLDQVRIGIDAPRNIPIDRKEIREKKRGKFLGIF